MNLLVDGTIFRWQARGGISAIYRRLLPLAAADQRLDIRLALQGRSQTRQLDELHPFKVTIPSLSPHLRPWRLWRHFRQPYDNCAWWLSMLTNDADVYHPAFYRPSPRTGQPSFCFAYDMIAERYPASFSAGFVENTLRLKKLTMQRSSRVLCISENTRRDVVEMLGVDENKCRVVYLGPSIEPVQSAPDDKAAVRPYFLFVGDYPAPYKNFEFVLKALSSPELSEYNNYQLQVVSHKIPTAQQLAYYHTMLGPDRLMFLNECSDARLAQLYAGCAALIYPSLYEGFGMPVLDALNSGAPAVCSNTSSLPEVGGEAAYYFDPHSITELAAALSRAVADDRRPEAVAGRKKQAERFSWKKTSKAFVDTCFDIG